MAKSCFQKLLKLFPDSDWACDSEERLQKIDKILAGLEEIVENMQTADLSWTK